MKITNKTAHYHYHVLEKIEAGIDLLGPEVKSVRAGKVSLNQAFVKIRNGQAYLFNTHIHPYQNSLEAISPTRPRKLLLHKKEIASLEGKTAATSLTLIPLALYNKGNIIKLEIALARGKKKWDKRRNLKEQAEQRETEQILRGKNRKSEENF